MHAYYTFLALDIARQRSAEAEAERLALLGRPAPTRASIVRRAVARVAIAVARAADRDLRVSYSAR
jgi:hypothetical protein